MTKISDTTLKLKVICDDSYTMSDKEWSDKYGDKKYYEVLEDFLATALEEQRAKTLEDFVNKLLRASNVDIDQESKNHIQQIYQYILNGKDE